jgi:hypothetical protein
MSSSQDSWSQRIKISTPCPACSTSFDVLHAKVIETYPDAHLVHFTCDKCRNALLAVVALSSDATQTVGLLTDLSYEDVLRFSKMQMISIEDVVDAHEYFEKKGWANAFLKRKKQKRKKKQ